MNKKLFTLFILGLNIIYILAVPVAPRKFNVLQNGDTIEIYLKGDEYGLWYETKNGDIVDIDPNTQNFYYVKPVTDTKVREMDVAENNPTIVMNLDGLNSGVYVLRLIIDNQIVEASQLIVR